MIFSPPILAAGTLSGIVVNAADNTAPVYPVIIDLADPVTGSWLGISQGNSANGRWEISGLSPGDYKVFFNAIDTANSFTDELYDGVPCDNGGCDVQSLGTVYTVAEGLNTLDIDMQIDGELSGQVLDASDGITPVHPVIIDLADPTTGAWLEISTNNETDGSWSIGGITPGDYKVFFNAVGNAEVYDDELYDDVVCDNGGCDVQNLGTVYQVNEGENILNVELNKSLLISGTVIDESGAPVEGVSFEVFTSHGQSVGNVVLSSASGTWSKLVSESGTYYVRATQTSGGLEPKLWNDRSCVNCDPTFSGDPIVVNSTDISEINFLMCSSGDMIFTGGFESGPGSQTDVITCTEADSTVDYWNYWIAEDVRSVDLWGDSDSEHRDIVATYAKLESDRVVLRIDYFDLKSASVAPTYFGLDYKSGGVRNVIQGNQNLQLDINWDILLVADGTGLTAYDSDFTQIPAVFSDRVLDQYVDFVSFGVPNSVLSGWTGGAFSLQALTPLEGNAGSADLSPVGSTSNSAGTGKLIIGFMNSTLGMSPANISWWDGYGLEPSYRPGERRGLAYLVNAADKYNAKLTITDMRVDQLAGAEFLGILDRFRAMASRRILELVFNMNYGHFMAWWPDYVNRNAIELNIARRKSINIPSSGVIYPYEVILKHSDIEVLKDAGLTGIWAWDQYRHWFGWIEDWSDPEVVEAELKSARKIHRVNGLDLMFDFAVGNYRGWVTDERWEEIPDDFTLYELTRGTHQGFHKFYRRTLLDMAIDSDQQQFVSVGSDLYLTEWMFEDVSDWNLKWISSHPWIEMVLPSELLSKGWSVIDHGTLDLPLDEMLIQYPHEDDGHYNAYIRQHYYGGISDGHSPIIPKGVEIEALYDYVPILRDGVTIPSGRIIGDDKTPGSIIYETLKGLESLPDNNIKDLAWLAFHHVVAELTFHDAEKLHTTPKVQSNYIGHIGKIVAAAHWVESAKNGELSSATVVAALDLDLDGEDEYTISNDKVFAVLENDGGRVEYAFAYDSTNGAIQLVAPFNQSSLLYLSTQDFSLGEVGFSETAGGHDSVFVEDHDGGNFTYSVMTASLGVDSIKFQTTDGNVIKEFTLAGDVLNAEYWVNEISGVSPGFGFVTNMASVYDRNWEDRFKDIDIPGQERGWKNLVGGYASVMLGESTLWDAYSFKDSPARFEMRERDDPDTYPRGHWEIYPYGFVQTGSQADSRHFTIGVKLKASSE